MKVTLESTDKVVTLVVGGNDIPARVWQGQTAEGVEIHAFITRVAVKEGQDPAIYQTFERELKETAKARPDIQAIPLRFIL